MLQRNRGGNFGGAWVFPGGKIDPGDHLGEVNSSVPADARAAARECREEAGIDLRPEVMLRWSHWTPPERAGVRFSTAFFVATASSAEHTVVVDGSEIVRHSWMTAAEVLAMHRRGEMELAPPTFITVCQVAMHRTVDSALETARASKVEHFRTRIAVADDEVMALYHDDVAYETLDLSALGPLHRLTMRRPDANGQTNWEYVRNSAILAE